MSLTADRRASEHVGPAPATIAAPLSARPGLARTIFNLLVRDRTCDVTPEMLSDHLLQDIGLSRADLQALRF